jgi:hypothetical protein
MQVEPPFHIISMVILEAELSMYSGKLGRHMTYIKLRQSHAAVHFEASSGCVVIHTDVSCSYEGVQVTGQTAACSEPSPPRDPQDLERKYEGGSFGLVVFSTASTDTLHS